MPNFLSLIKSLWAELDSVIELFVYLAIAFAITKLFGTTYMQAIGIVFLYFIMNLLRIVVEAIKNKQVL